jgi:uncharacterized protein CbrC (UPF0167 family)
MALPLKVMFSFSFLSSSHETFTYHTAVYKEVVCRSPRFYSRQEQEVFFSLSMCVFITSAGLAL